MGLDFTSSANTSSLQDKGHPKFFNLCVYHHDIANARFIILPDTLNAMFSSTVSQLQLCHPFFLSCISHKHNVVCRSSVLVLNSCRNMFNVCFFIHVTCLLPFYVFSPFFIVNILVFSNSFMRYQVSELHVRHL